jgi:hypothetical protein
MTHSDPKPAASEPHSPSMAWWGACKCADCRCVCGRVPEDCQGECGWEVYGDDQHGAFS